MGINKKSSNIFFKFLIIIILLVVVITAILFYYYGNLFSSYFKPLTSTELDSLISVEADLKPLRDRLQDVFIYAINNNKIKNADVDDLKKFLHTVFKEYNNVFIEYKNNGIEIQNKNKFYNYFLDYIKKSKLSYFLSESMYNTYPFIKNMSSVVHNKYRYALEALSKKQKRTMDKNTFEFYVDRLGLFLASYKNTSKNAKFISSYEKKNEFKTKTQQEFKRSLVFIWKLGSYICFKIQNQESPTKEIEIFDKYFLYLFEKCYKERGFPFGYDWFLFASHYPIILSYKLYIDYKTKNIIIFKYINEILKFIPKINYSKNIKRYNSNVAIMSISFIIANLFKNYNSLERFHDFVLELLNSDVYNDEIIINYQDPKNDKFENGLYFDGGFVIHQNLVSYNYLTAYLYPSIFYKIMFNEDTKNIEKICKAVYKFAIQTRKINPVIISRYGKFDEINNSLLEFIEHANDLKIDYKDKYVEKYINHKNDVSKEILGVHVYESARFVVGNYDTWSIQLKINSELAYGEVDVYNKQILKQISMNKIMIFDDFNLEEFGTHSLYPGVMSYKKYLDKSEVFTIPYGTNTFTYKEAKYTYKQLDNNRIIIYSKIFNDEIKLKYEEFVMITEFGIIVGYLNIEKYLNDGLFLTVSSPLIKNKTQTNILYSEDKSPLFDYNTALVKKINNNILYSNTLTNSPAITCDFKIKNNNINFILKLDKTYTITLNKNMGIQIFVN